MSKLILFSLAIAILSAAGVLFRFLQEVERECRRK